MGPFSSRSDSSRKLTFLLIAVLLPPAMALVWLGVRLLKQDQTLLMQRDAERREAAADIIVRTIGRSVGDAERWFVDGAVPKGARNVRKLRRGVWRRLGGVVPLQLLVVSFLGWLQREQHDIIQYLREENRVLRA